MAERFDQYQFWSTRALQVYQILVGQAYNRQTRTYGMIAGMIGFDGAGVVARPLARIAYWCIDKDLPHLTAIVVNQDTGLPGYDIPTGARDLNEIREEVFNFDWFALVPPTPEALEDSFQRHHPRT